MSVGVGTIDLEHQELFSLFGDLMASAQAGFGSKFVEHTLEKFVTYTAYHFAQEEEFLEGIGYPGVGDHAEQHRRLLEDLDWFTRHYFGEGGKAPNAEALHFLGIWMIDHILEWDIPYAAFVKESNQV